MKSGTRRLSEDHKAYLSFHRDLWQKRNDVSDGSRALYCCLLTYENLKTNQCRPCQETLARHLSTSTRSISRRTRELETKNLCRTELIWWQGKKKLIYTLYTPCPSNATGAILGEPTAKIVPFPSPSSIGSTSSTTLKGQGPST